MTARARSPRLAAFVSSLEYHDGEMPEAIERVLPTARVHLMVNLLENEFRTYEGTHATVVHRTAGSILAGPHSRPIVIDTREQRHLVIVNFRPGGAASFFRCPVSEGRDRLVELGMLWGRDGRLVRERLLEAGTPGAKLNVLEAVLLEHISGSTAIDPAISFAAGEFERGAPVRDVTDALGLLPKTFVRRFRADTGLTPKRFSRVRRLQRLLRSTGDPASADWAQLAAEHGYADQAHLIHDFRALTGFTPGSYRPRSVEERNHVPVRPSSR